MPTAATRRVRKKMHVERLILRRPGNQAIIAASIRGSVSADSLENALSAVRNRYPLMWARVVVEGDGSAWFVTDDSVVPEIEVQMRTSDSQWTAIMREEHGHYFNSETGPLSRFVLVQGQTRSELIVNCHHAICDGLSLVYLVRDLLSYVAGCIHDFAPIALEPPVSKETVALDVRGNLFARGVVRLANWIWNRHTIRLGEEEFKKLHDIYWADKTPCVLAWTLQDIEVEALVQRSRNEGVTVHSAICTAFYIAQNQTQRTSAKHGRRVHIPVDIRSRLSTPAGEAFGFYAAPIIVDLPALREDESFWASARRVHKRIRRYLADEHVLNILRIDTLDPLLVDSLYFAKFGMIRSRVANAVVRSMGLSSPLAGFAVTNLGLVPIPTSYGRLELNGLFGPSVFSDLLEKVFGVATVGDTMCFTVVFDRNTMDVAAVERIRDLAMHLLAKAAG